MQINSIRGALPELGALSVSQPASAPALSAQQLAQLELWFRYHPPKPDQVPKYERVRAAGFQFAAALMADCPPESAELKTALASARAAVAWANASIACAQGPARELMPPAS